jgi:D-alanyl-lipoteichoic acid acyltransferase DltB (MBOAT superfamily)
VSEAAAAVRPTGVPRIGGTLVLLVGAVLTAGALLADFRPQARVGTFGLGQAVAACIGLVIATAGYDVRRGRGGDWLGSLAEIRAHALPLLALLGQLALLVFVTGWFQIENPAFAQMVVPLAAVGFLLHHILPVTHRLAYFAALSLIGFVLVLGWANAAWLVGLTLLFVGLCHLPLPWMGRVAALLVAGVLLGVMRAQPALTPFSSAIWPVLGSILMFRLIVYAYDVRNSKERIPLRLSLAYFFMLPNVVFPLFPVVDFATFKRVHYDRDAVGTYQRGIDWMVRGLVHLLLYRVVYQHFTLAPSEVANGSQLVQYMVSTFLLYLRVSGTFHFIIGLLHLFGFRLPETHRFFYLASTFTDFWRRINIYWKDFMMKLVFYPVYFPLRKRGETTALVVATLSVFLITWLTHSYQWFWILGKWLLSWTDGLFWALLGVLLVVNSLWEAKHGRKRSLPGAKKRVRDALAVAGKATLVFATICTLWSLWGSPTLGDWFDLMSVRWLSWTDWAAVAGILGLIAVSAFAGEMTGRSQGDTDRGAQAERTPWHRPALVTGGQLGLIALVSMPLVLGRTPADVQQFARDLRVPELNKRDAAALQRGYYENLQGVSLQNNQLWELYAQRPAEGQDIWKSGVLREREDFLARDMNPNFGIFEGGKSFRTNRWGMRDRDYELAKAPGLRRIAILGQSYVAGDGVGDGETFDEVVENRLASEGVAPRTEILNFGVGSYSLLQQLLLLEERIWAFSPDAILVVGHPGDAERIAIHLVQQLRRGVLPPFAPVRDVLARAQVTPEVRETEALSRLSPYRDELVSWTLKEIVTVARARGVRPVWVYLSTPERGPAPEQVQAMVRQARAAGFEVRDWSDVYDGVDVKTLQASQWDFHPNAAGHELIAQRLYRELASDTTFGPVRPSSAPPARSTQENRP